MFPLPVPISQISFFPMSWVFLELDWTMEFRSLKISKEAGGLFQFAVANCISAVADWHSAEVWSNLTGFFSPQIPQRLGEKVRSTCMGRDAPCAISYTVMNIKTRGNETSLSKDLISSHIQHILEGQ